jgi:hypothetical protein
MNKMMKKMLNFFFINEFKFLISLKISRSRKQKNNES